jgi:hypothetical protein
MLVTQKGERIGCEATHFSKRKKAGFGIVVDMVSKSGV